MGKDSLHKLKKAHGYMHEKRLSFEKLIDSGRTMGKGFITSFAKEEDSEENYPVDFVVLWLDARDPKWIADKNKYLPDDKNVSKNNSAARFRNWDIFKYWFKS